MYLLGALHYLKSNMKIITITVSVDGNSISREFRLPFPEVKDWCHDIYDMLDTIEQSNKPFKEEEREHLIDNLTKEQEDKLKEAHAKDYYGTDDNMPDAYESWLEDLSLEDLKKIIWNVSLASL